MIARLTGTVVEKGGDWAVIETGGVGYLLHLTSAGVAALPPVGSVCTLHSYLHVREDALQLYGFASANEKEIFRQLISVSGVGPRVALGVLSHLRAEKLAAAIASGDSELLASVPGVGKKTAARLILELREKLKLPEECVSAVPGAVSREARGALMSLGYSVSEADSALEGLESDISAEECVKLALKRLGASR